MIIDIESFVDRVDLARYDSGIQKIRRRACQHVQAQILATPRRLSHPLPQGGYRVDDPYMGGALGRGCAWVCSWPVGLMNVKGPFSAKLRKRTKNSERRDHYLMVHREWDNRPVPEIVSQVIRMTISLNLDQKSRHVY